jgi:hypothetical protein
MILLIKKKKDKNRTGYVLFFLFFFIFLFFSFLIFRRIITPALINMFTDSRTHFSKAWYIAATYLTTLNVFPLKPIARHFAYTEKRKKKMCYTIFIPLHCLFKVF